MIDRERTIKEFGYSPDDLSKYSHKIIWAICDECGKERLVRFGAYKIKCKSCVHKRINLSKETLQKMKKCNLGRIHTKESRANMSKNHADMSGKNNPHYGKYGEKSSRWNPNLTDRDREVKRNYPAYYEWRKKVFERDSYTCQICYKLGVYLNAHHLDGYAENPEIRTTLENGVTLCKKCHDDFHHQYGRGNNTREQFIEFKG